MSIASKGFSALGKLVALAVIAAAFLFGMAGVVYMSLQGEEVKVPEIVGKDLNQSKNELASLGLKIKQRADRTSPEPPNTILEQLPKPGETVKTGQMILVVVSKGGGEADASAPKSLKDAANEDDSEKIEEMISEKPKKPKANTNSNKKKTDKTRDVIDDNSNTGDTGTKSDTDKKDASPGDSGTKENKNSTGKPADKPSPAPANRPAAKPSSGETRSRTAPKP